jgi:hypothetical protein
MDALAATGHEFELRRSTLPAVEEEQILERLRMTPTQRVETFLASHRNMARVLGVTRRLGSETP